MARPILSIEEPKNASQAKSIANLLPCHIHHDGPIDALEDYWKPTKPEAGTRGAYFRGRKLQGKTVALPEKYRGVMVEHQEDKPQQAMPEDIPEDGDEEKPTETGTLRVTAEFDEMVIWGHESVASSEEDPYVRSIEEWLQFSEKIHAYPEPEDKGQK